MNPPSVSLQSLSPTWRSFDTLGDIVSVVLKNALVLAGILTFILLILGAFNIIVSAGGDPKKAEQGRGAITGAVIGLLIIVGSFWIIQIINKITGLTLLQ